MKLRKLTLEVYVDQDSKDWHWIVETMKPADTEFANGLCARSMSNGWIGEETRDALMWAHNARLKAQREGE